MRIDLTLVNKNHPLPGDWAEKTELVSGKNVLQQEYRLEKETMKQFLALRDRLLGEGIEIDVESAYRSVEKQAEVWAEFERDCGLEYCRRYVAAPGCSEHHTGLALDICFVRDGAVMEGESAEKDALFARVHAVMPAYGFILRYLPGKEAITGYAYEPWHLRYVGVESAKEIAGKGWTLEEYLEQGKSDDR